MASNNNNDTEPMTKLVDWLGVIRRKDMNKNVSSPLGMLNKEKPLSYFDALTKNCLWDLQRFQVNLVHFP